MKHEEYLEALQGVEGIGKTLSTKITDQYPTAGELKKALESGAYLDAFSDSAPAKRVYQPLCEAFEVEPVDEEDWDEEDGDADDGDEDGDADDEDDGLDPDDANTPALRDEPDPARHEGPASMIDEEATGPLVLVRNPSARNNIFLRAEGTSYRIGPQQELQIPESVLESDEGVEMLARGRLEKLNQVNRTTSR